MIKKTSSNQSCGRDRECKRVRFKVPQYIWLSSMFAFMTHLNTCNIRINVSIYNSLSNINYFAYIPSVTTIAILAELFRMPFCVLKAVSRAYLIASEVCVVPLVYLKKMHLSRDM